MIPIKLEWIVSSPTLQRPFPFICFMIGITPLWIITVWIDPLPLEGLFRDASVSTLREMDH